MSPTFFADRNLGKAFPAALRAAGIRVETHDDHFAQDTADERWIGKVSARRWVVVTKDSRIRYKPNELAAVVAAKARMLVLVGHVRHAEHAENFIRTMPRIAAFLEKHHGPMIAKVYRPSAAGAAEKPAASGRIELWYPKARKS